MKQPSIGNNVHYVSYGTPGGEYKSECRAAAITQVHKAVDRLESHVGLVIFNPTGMFFNPDIPYAGSANPEEAEMRGGTWHWPCHE